MKSQCNNCFGDLHLLLCYNSSTVIVFWNQSEGSNANLSSNCHLQYMPTAQYFLNHTVTVRQEVPWKLFDFVVCFQFPLSRQLEQQIKSFYHLHVSEWHRPHTQQTRSHPTLCLGWHESGWQRTRQTLTQRECVWGHRRSRRSCCVKHHTASWQGAPSSEQCSLRLAALWTGFTRRELRLVGSAHTVPTLSSKAPRY